MVFSYDPQGRRYSKTAYERDGQGNYTVEKYARFYHYDSGGNVLCETDAAGNIIRSYAYDISGHPIAFTQDLGQGQRTFYVHTNARGDVVCITDDVMDRVKKFTYDPWGNITSETAKSSEYEALSCPYAYAGYFLDAETGLYCMPARYYSPAQRRFLTRDPHPGSKSQPITLNPCQYCGNNPVNKVDPTGQYDWDAVLNTIAGAARAAGAAVNQATAARALIRGGGLQAASFASSMSSFRSSVASSMSNMGGLVSSIRAGVSMAIAGVNGLVNFNWGSMASVGIRGGIATGSPLHQAFQIELAVEGQITAARNVAFRRYADDIFSSQPGLWDTILYNPVANVVIGAAEVIAGGIAIWGTGGLAIELAGPVVLDGGNRFVKGLYKLSVGDWTGEETEQWWPIP